MPGIPIEINQRLRAYCADAGLEDQELRGYGVDGYVWQTTQDTILKVFRSESPFQHELAVYRRLQANGVKRLQGFRIPQLLNYREDLLTLELSYVRPPFALDFAGATLGSPPPGFDFESVQWTQEKRAIYGAKWPEVSRLLDALRHLGIYYPDVHPGNIRVEE
jgi:hypothetical protein